MMVQEVVLAPTPMPPSIVTESQSRTRDDATEENMFSEALNNAASQPRHDATDEIAFSEVQQETSPARLAATAPAAQPPRDATAHTPERNRTTGGSETDEVHFFTETTQDLHTQPESDAQRALPVLETNNNGVSPKATPADLDVTARPAVAPTAATAPPPLSSTGTPSFVVEGENASETAGAEHQHESDRDSQPAEEVTEAAVPPPVPRTRGPGHTPRGARPDSTHPPTRPPSRTSSRFGTPRVSRGDYGAPARGGAAPPQSLVPDAQASGVPRLSVAQSDRSIAFQVDDDTQDAATPLEGDHRQASRTPPMPRASVAQSDRSIAFQVEDEVSEATSVAFQVEPTAMKRRKSEGSVDQTTTTDGSEIHFNVVPETQVSRPSDARGVVESSVAPSVTTDGSEIHFNVEQSRGSRVPAPADRAATNSMTSVQFEMESTANNTRQSSISHFTVENDEPEPMPVETSAAAVAPATTVPEEIVTESEERRRAQKAEEERRKKALEERAKYMNTRPWDSNAPSPRARRTSSQAAAHGRDKQEAERRDSAARRHSDMYARPWRTGMATTPRKREATEKKPHDAYDRPWRTHMATSPKKAEAVQPGPANERPWRTGMATTPKKKRAATSDSDSEEEDNKEREHKTWQQAFHAKQAPSSSATSSPSVQSSVVRHEPREVASLLPVQPAFDTAEAAKFVTPAPVLKAPLEVLGEEVEAWSETASQQRNLQAILEVMRMRERQCARLSSQQVAQVHVAQRLNKELYTVRDAFVRRNGADVTGMPLHARKEANPEDKAEAVAAGAATPDAVSDRDYTLLRLYPRQTHQATDYVALKQQRSGGPAVSVLSDGDMSEGEREDFAQELADWRAERQQLRKERARVVHERRDLTFQMRRGSNIKDLKLTQPTSGRGPLDRRASGTETKVDIDGYDRLMEERIAAQKATVEAANAKEQYESLCMVAATMRKQHDTKSREMTDAQEVQEETKEHYEDVLKSIRAQIENARPLIDKAQATLKRREREALHSEEERAQAELREYSDAILAVRLQVDRAAAMADAASGDEERMRRASTPHAGGMSRAATPRGSVSGSLRPGASPRGRTASMSNNDDVFARLTGRKSVDVQNGLVPGTPMEAPVEA